MIELLVGLVVGVVAMIPTLLAAKALVRDAREDAESYRLGNGHLLEKIDFYQAKLEARTFNESLSVSALLDRPEPEKEIAGRWLHSDDGLVTEFVPD